MEVSSLWAKLRDITQSKQNAFCLEHAYLSVVHALTDVSRFF